MEVSRRTFLKLGIATGGGVALAGASTLVPGGVKTVDWLAEQEIHRDLLEEWVPSVCGACPAVCPIMLRRIGGNIVGVRPMKPKPCARAYTIPQELYHPDRLHTSLKNDAKNHGARSAQNVSIDKNAALAELVGILKKSGPKTAFIVRDSAGLSFTLLKAVGVALGASVFTMQWSQSQGPHDAIEEFTGWGNWRFDLANANGVISFGWDWLQNYTDPAEAQVAFAALREKNAPMVFIGSRLNLTAMKSEWIACRPGLEPLVALAIASIIIREKQYDQACEQIEGFADFTRELEKLDLNQVKQQTGVSIQKIQRLTRSLVTRRPIICLAQRGRMEDQRAIVYLNATLGNIARQGGVLPLPEVNLPISSSQQPQIKNIEDLPAVIPQDIETLVLIGVNPAFTSPAPSRWKDALKKAKHVICVSSILNEACSLADLVIPLAYPAEYSDIFPELQNDGVKSIFIEPAFEPKPDVFSPGELAFELAGRLAVNLPWKNLEEAAKALGVRQPSIKPRFGTLDWKPPEFTNGDFFLLFEIPGAFYCMEGAHLPYLLTTVGPHLREWWTTWVEINPETAHRLGIKDRDLLILESSIGSIQARARYYSGVPEDAVCVPLGMGHTIGAFAQKEGGNPAEMIELRQDNKTGLPLWNLQKVRLRKV